MDPMPYKIKRFRRLQFGEIQELEPVRKKVCSDPIGNHIILLRRYIMQVNELLNTAKKRNTKKQIPDMPLPDYPEDFPFKETLLSKRDFPKVRVRFLFPVSKAYVEQQQIVSIHKILAQTGYYVKESRITVKRPESKAEDLQVKIISSRGLVAESEPAQKGDSTPKKNPDSENKECEKSKNKRPNDEESKNEEKKNKTGESKDGGSTDKVTETVKNKEKRNAETLEGSIENESVGCEEESKKSDGADKDKGNENQGKTNENTGDENTESEDSESDDSESEDTETEESEFENPISEEEDVFPVKVLSCYLTEFIKNFVALMKRIKLAEPYPEDNNLWNALETTLQRIGFDGIEGLYKFYYQRVYHRHKILLKECEDLQKKYNEYQCSTRGPCGAGKAPKQRVRFRVPQQSKQHVKNIGPEHLGAAKNENMDSQGGHYSGSTSLKNT